MIRFDSFISKTIDAFLQRSLTTLAEIRGVWPTASERDFEYWELTEFQFESLDLDLQTLTSSSSLSTSAAAALEASLCPLALALVPAPAPVLV